MPPGAQRTMTGIWDADTRTTTIVTVTLLRIRILALSLSLVVKDDDTNVRMRMGGWGARGHCHPHLSVVTFPKEQRSVWGPFQETTKEGKHRHQCLAVTSIRLRGAKIGT